MPHRTSFRARVVIESAERRVAEGVACWRAMADALLESTDGAHSTLLASIGVDAERLRAALERIDDRDGPTIDELRRRADRDAAALLHKWLGCEHLLVALVTLGPPRARGVFESHGASRARLVAALDERDAESPIVADELRCSVCGYDVRATRGGVCPECGDVAIG